MNRLRVFTAFSGYDSQCLALNRLRETHGVYYELVGWSEIDKDAIKAHNALFPDAADKNFGDISKIDWAQVPDFDLFTYSSPCQDFSNAGLQRGGEEGSGTRSSLLWECRRAIVAKKPSFLLLENVKALTSEKFLPLLQKWCAELSSYGYINHCAVLNAKDYGVPQNRERVFVFSVRKDIPGASDYRFPRPFPLKRKLRNILEEDVDEKYYLKDETVEKFLRKTAENKEKGLGFAFPPPNPDGVSYTLKCQGYESCADPRYIDLLGYTRGKSGDVDNYHPVSVANTLHTSSGSGGNTDQFVRVGSIRTRPAGGGAEIGAPPRPRHDGNDNDSRNI